MNIFFSFTKWNQVLYLEFCLLSNFISKIIWKIIQKTYSTQTFLNKSFANFIMYSNSIFPITDLPRGLGLNFFSLVVYETVKEGVNKLQKTDFCQWVWKLWPPLYMKQYIRPSNCLELKLCHKRMIIDCYLLILAQSAQDLKVIFRWLRVWLKAKSSILMHM